MFTKNHLGLQWLTELLPNTLISVLPT